MKNPKANLNQNSLEDYEDEPEEETYKIVNKNKHVFNGNDGGRTRKMRHISKIDTFIRGHEAIKPFCKDLFDVKKSKEIQYSQSSSLDFG